MLNKVVNILLEVTFIHLIRSLNSEIQDMLKNCKQDGACVYVAQTEQTSAFNLLNKCMKLLFIIQTLTKMKI